MSKIGREIWSGNERLQRLVIATGLTLLVSMIYRQVTVFEFIGFDDPAYVYLNPHVATGLTPANIYWAFTSIDTNWHPLTWLSHMLDVSLFGLAPGYHHLVNLLYHLLNTVLLFLLLVTMTGATWKSAMVAALFALHPMHVESVAWVAERKDLLSTLFALLTLLAYRSYVLKEEKWRYGMTMVLFAAGLMAKPMLVTLPLIMLLLDYWPLGRRRISGESAAGNATFTSLILEKLPLFLLSLLSGVVTVIAQSKGGALVPLTDLTLVQRLANAAASYAGYVSKAVWPHRQAIIYPMPATSGTWVPLAAGSLLLMATVAAIRFRKDRPYLPFGWLFFLTTLMPVIGLVQVGNQAMADRYTYLPYTGLFVLAAWGAEDVAKSFHLPKRILVAAGSVLLICFSIITHRYLGTWRDSIALFSNAVTVAGNYHITRNHLGLALAERNRFRDAAEQFDAAITIKPDFAIAHYNLGLAMLNMGEHAQAVRHFTDAVTYDPDYIDAYYNRALVHSQSGDRDRAVADLMLVLAKKRPHDETNHVDQESALRLLEELQSSREGQRAKGPAVP